MTNGLLGKKIGMSQIFAADGQRIPVTILEVGPCTVLQKKTTATDGYDAVQLGFQAKDARRVNKPEMVTLKRPVRAHLIMCVNLSQSMNALSVTRYLVIYLVREIESM